MDLAQSGKLWWRLGLINHTHMKNILDGESIYPFFEYVGIFPLMTQPLIHYITLNKRLNAFFSLISHV